MALSILDGNQSATTLSTILSSGQHITAHTVISLGTQAITDIVNATSANLTNTQLRASAVTVGGTVTVGNFPASQAVTFGAVTGSVSVLNFPASQAVTFSAVSISNFPATQPVSIASVTIGNTVTIAGTVTANPTGTQTVAGTVTANVFGKDYDGTAVALPILANEGGVATRGIPIGYNDNASSTFFIVSDSSPLPVSPALYDGEPTSIRLGQDGDASSPNFAVPIGFAGDGGFKRVAFNAGLPISGTVTIGSLPAISGTVTANTFALQGTAVTTSNFTSTTASTVLANFNAGREVLTIFNEGAGNLFVCPGATCTTVQYQVRLSSGDYYEVPNHQTTITHSAVFATAGTARVTEVS